MDANTIASVASGAVAAIALVRTFGREKADDQDQRIRELIKLEVGADLALLKDGMRRIMRKLDINGDD